MKAEMIFWLRLEIEIFAENVASNESIDWNKLIESRLHSILSSLLLIIVRQLTRRMMAAM